MNRGNIDVEDLLKVILVLVIVWIAAQILIDILEFAFGSIASLLGVLIVILIVAYFLDYI